MKRLLIFLAAAVTICSCGPSKQLSNPGDEEINVGYGTTTKDDNNYSVSKLKVGGTKQAMTYTDMYDYLRGRVPGVTVTSSNSIVIRGLDSNNQTEPLILVDGVEIDDLSTVDPQMVDYVEVLKDGSASIYGMRGGNGVILITTKR